MNKYLKLDDVLEIVGFSKSTLYKHMNKIGDFPKPVMKIFGKYNRWSLEQVELFLSLQKRAF